MGHNQSECCAAVSPWATEPRGGDEEDSTPQDRNRWIAKGELEAFRAEGRGFRFVDAEQVRALGLSIQGFYERGAIN